MPNVKFHSLHFHKLPHFFQANVEPTLQIKDISSVSQTQYYKQSLLFLFLQIITGVYVSMSCHVMRLCLCFICKWMPCPMSMCQPSQPTVLYAITFVNVYVSLSCNELIVHSFQLNGY